MGSIVEIGKADVGEKSRAMRRRVRWPKGLMAACREADSVIVDAIPGKSVCQAEIMAIGEKLKRLKRRIKIGSNRRNRREGEN